MPFRLPYHGYSNEYQGGAELERCSAKPELGVHPTEDLAASDYSGELLHVRYEPYDGEKLDALDEFVVNFKFYHDVNRTKPCMFYEFTQDLDSKGHNLLYYDKGQWSEEAYKAERIEDRSQPTNSIKRVRHDWNPFDIFVPDFIISYADEDVKKTERGENDTIYMYPDVYGKDSMLYRKASYYFSGYVVLFLRTRLVIILIKIPLRLFCLEKSCLRRKSW